MKTIPTIDLWIDDERDPNSQFIRETFGAKEGMTWVKNTKEALDVIKTGNVRSISFDHDLGDEVKNGNGYKIVCYMESIAFHDMMNSNPNFNRIEMKVHSANPVGRKNIESSIKKCNEFWDDIE